MRALLLTLLIACSGGTEPPPRAVPSTSAQSSAATPATPPSISDAASATPAPAEPSGSARVGLDRLPEPFPCPVATGPVTKVADLTQAVAMVADASGVFWSDGSALHQTSLDGKSTKQLSRKIVPLGRVSGMSQRGDELLIWSSDSASTYQCSGALVLFSKSSGKATTVHQGHCVWSAAANEQRVVFSTRVSSGQGWFTGRVSWWDREKRTTELLWDQTSEYVGVEVDGERALAVFPGQVYELTSSNKNAPASRTQSFSAFGDFRGGDERLVARDGRDLYLVATGGSTGQKLYSFSLDKDAMTVLGAESESSSPYGVTAVGTPSITARYVYWASPLHNQIRRADRAGKCGVEIVARDRNRPDWVSAVGDDVYWLEGAPARALVRRGAR
jgi:hypothetical protein